MGFGGILGAVGGLIASGGNPAGAVAGYSIGNSLGGGKSSSGTAADPSTYLNIKIPGFKYPGVNTDNLVNMPSYPGYNPYQNPYVSPAPVFQGPTFGEQGATHATNQSLAAIQAMLDPSNQLQKNLASSQSQLMRTTFLSNLRDIQRANQRARMSGRAAYFNPESADSTGMRSIMDNAYQSQLGGQIQAQNILSDVARQLQSTASSYRDVGNMEQGRRNDYTTQLNDRLNQMSQNYNNSYNAQNTQATNAYQANTNNILNALNLYKGNQAQLQPAQQAYQASSTGSKAAGVQGILDLLKNPSVSNNVSAGTDYLKGLMGNSNSGNVLNDMEWLSYV